MSISSVQTHLRDDRRHYKGWSARKIDGEQKPGDTEEVRRLVVLSRVVAGISHDLRTFSAHVIGLAGLIKTRIDSDKSLEIGSLVTLLERAAKDVAALVEQIVDLGTGRNERLKESVELAQCIDRVGQLMGPYFREMSFEIENKLPHQLVLGNALQIQQVLVNLLRNAQQALSKHGCTDGHSPKVSLIVHELKREWDHAIVGIQKGKTYIGISIVDNGIGMDSSVLERIATPFFTTRGKCGGTGLGLFMSAYLVEVHGGALVVRTKKDEGTVMTVCLPV